MSGLRFAVPGAPSPQAFHIAVRTVTRDVRNPTKDPWVDRLRVQLTGLGDAPHVDAVLGMALIGGEPIKRANVLRAILFVAARGTVTSAEIAAFAAAMSKSFPADGSVRATRSLAGTLIADGARFRLAPVRNRRTEAYYELAVAFVEDADQWEQLSKWFDVSSAQRALRKLLIPYREPVLYRAPGSWYNAGSFLLHARTFELNEDKLAVKYGGGKAARAVIYLLSRAPAVTFAEILHGLRPLLRPRGNLPLVAIRDAMPDLRAIVRREPGGCMLCKEPWGLFESCGVARLTLDGKSMARVRVGQGTLDRAMSPHGCCFRCGAPWGGVHHGGCLSEDCPRCRDMQVAACDCAKLEGMYDAETE